MSSGQKLVTAYFVVAYLLPIAGNLAFGDQIVSTYQVLPLTLYGTLELVGTYGLFLVLSASLKRATPGRKMETRTSIAEQIGRQYLRARLFVALASVLLASFYFSTGQNSYRYTEQGISGSSSSVLLFVNVLNIIITIDLFWSIFVRSGDDVKPFSRRYVEGILLSLALVLSANGTVTMFVALNSVLFSLFPQRFSRYVFVRPGKPNLRHTIKQTALLTVVMSVFLLAWVAGESIKGLSAAGQTSAGAVGNVVDRINATDGFAEGYFYYLIESASSHYYSWLFTNGLSREELSYGAVSPLSFPLSTLAFRTDYLLGGITGAPRPEVGSLSRLNYVLLVSSAASSRAGTSPGLLASFNYLSVSPLNIICATLYLCWVCRLVDKLVTRRGEKLSNGGLVLLLLFLAGLFQSPLDFLMIFDDSVVFLLLLVSLASTRSGSGTERVQWQPALRRVGAFR